MANRLALTAALLLALVAFTNATRYTTIVTTTTFDDEDTNRQEQGQGFQGKQFESCERWMNPMEIYEGRQQRGGEPLLISMNPSQKGGQVLSQCCDELRQVERERRCEAINHAVKQVIEDAQQQPQQQQRQGKQMQQEMLKTVTERAMLIPQLCQFRQPKQCQITGIRGGPNF